MPERHTLLTVIAGTVIGMPALTAARRSARRARETRRARDVRGLALRGKGSAQVNARRAVPIARARSRRGVCRGDGVRHQLQYGVDVDLRTIADVRLPEAPRQGKRVGQTARSALPRDG